MNNFESKDFRRFFDLLGSIFCGLLYGFSLWDAFFRFNQAGLNKTFVLPLFLLFTVGVYLAFHKSIWDFPGTKFLSGYVNFIFISVLSVTVIALPMCGVGLALYGPAGVSRGSFLATFIYSTFNFYVTTLLPLAFFSLLGILCGWKFSNRRALP